MINNDAYMHFENKKLKKTDKLSAHFKKMILIEYRNHSIYCLYDKESNLIFVSCSVDVNENSMLKKITAAEVYKVESFTAEFIKSFINAFINSFIKFSQINKSINESIFKHVTLSVRDKYKSEDKMSNSSSQTEISKIRCERFIKFDRFSSRRIKERIDEISCRKLNFVNFCSCNLL